MALKKHELMYRLFGKTEGHACRECRHLIRAERGARVVHKCRVYGVTTSEASDMASHKLACGQFNKPWGKGPVMNQIKPVRTTQEDAQRVPLDGQICLEV